MVLIIKGAINALLTLVCPHCHRQQVRAKKPLDAVYVCSKCHKHFTRRSARKAKR
jgi:transposase-like protein